MHRAVEVPRAAGRLARPMTSADEANSLLYTASAEATMTADVIKTFWTLDPFQCVLLDAPTGYAIHVFIRGEWFLRESVRTLAEAKGRADALFAIFFPRACVT